LVGCLESRVSPLEPSSEKRQDAAMAMTVLIVDDHPTFRSFARDLLESEGFEVIGEAEDGASAIEAATSVRPDLVLLDVQLPDISGFEVVERLRGDDLPSAVVLTSSRDASSYGDQVASSGAIGFIPKDELSGQGLRALLKEAS
jgi:DNA-binding NarL/FixJ family response regulator